MRNSTGVEKTLDPNAVKKLNKRENKLQKDEIAIVLVAIIPQLILMAIFYFYVNISSFALAFQTPRGEWTLQNIVSAWGNLTNVNSDMGVGVKNTLLYFLKDNLMLFFQLMISYFFYKKLKGTRVFQILFYIPGLISGVAIVGLFKQMVSRTGPLSIIFETLGIEMPFFLQDPKWATWTIMFYTIWLGWAGQMLLFNGALARIPVEIIESARIDGISSWKELVHIIFPLVWSTYSTLVILGFTGILDAGGPILLFTTHSAGPLKTYTIGYWMYYQVMQHDANLYNGAAAMGLLLTAIALPIILIARKIVEKVPTVEY